MDKTLEQFFESEGWSKWETIVLGKVQSTWRKHGFEIFEEDIIDNWENKRETATKPKTK